MDFKQEENIWSNDFLNRTYLDQWKKNFTDPDYKTHQSLEFHIRGLCNLKCKYCYLHNYRDQIFPKQIDDMNKSIENIEKILNWVRIEKLLPKSFEIFGGEAVSYKQYEKIFDLIYNFVKELNPWQKRKLSISIPVNVIFLKNKHYYDLFINAQRRFVEIGSGIFYSISMDGKYCDPYSRPAVNPDFKYTDEFYDIIQNFARDCIIKPGFHPMVAKENIKYWKKNFLWYLDYIKETYNLRDRIEATKHLYLLEVRNFDWADEDIHNLNSFIRFAINLLIKELKYDKEKFFDLYVYGKELNFFSLFGLNSKGISCSLQNLLAIRTPDLSVAPCHRLFYDDFISFKIDVKEDGRFEFKSENPHAHFASHAMNYRNISPCVSCEVNTLCEGPCLGSNYEATKDMFIVPDNVCQMEKNKVYTIIKTFDKIGILDKFINWHENNIRRRSDDYAIYIRSKLRQVRFLRSLNK